MMIAERCSPGAATRAHVQIWLDTTVLYVAQRMKSMF
jgi:hypothetical protein